MVLVQRSPAAALSRTEYEVKLKAVPAAPALSRALARVLSATESKEHEVETEHPDTGLEEKAWDNRPTGKRQSWLLMSGSCRIWYLAEIVQKPPTKPW